MAVRSTARRVLSLPCRWSSRPSLLRVLPPLATHSLTAARPYQHQAVPPDQQRAPLEDYLQIAFSRQDLLAAWHRAAREVPAPGALKWEGRDKLHTTCTVISPDGKVESVGPFKKQDLIQEFGMQARDLRSLDAHIMDVRPSLLVCKKSIILCTPIFRAIIAHDRLLIIGTDSSNPLVHDEDTQQLVRTVQHVMQHLDMISKFENTSQNSSKKNFEFRALEALLLITVRGFKEIASELQDRVYQIIPQLRFGVAPAELRDLLQAKRVVEDCLFSGRAMQSAVAAVLSEDEDLVGMYLTDKANGVHRAIEDHQNAELLLEYYERRLDETNESSVRLASLLSDLDSNISLTLQSTRVRLQNLELQTAIATLAVGSGAALGAFFGMNLVSGLENHPSAFYWASGAGVTIMGVVMAIGWVRLIRARRSQLLLGGSRHQRDLVLAARRSARQDRTTDARANSKRDDDEKRLNDKNQAPNKSSQDDTQKESAKQEEKKDGTQI